MVNCLFWLIPLMTILIIVSQFQKGTFLDLSKDVFAFDVLTDSVILILKLVL